MKQENRKISNIAAVIITLLMWCSFIFVWLKFYNDFTFRTYRFRGGIICVFVWLFLYLKFCKVYSSFKIASNSAGEIAFSQFLSISFSDLILYIVCCLAARIYIDIVPGAVTVCIQVVFGIIWSIISKRYFLKCVEPNKCILVSDANSCDIELFNCNNFVEKLQNKYGHLFNIEKQISLSNNLQDVLYQLDDYPIVFITMMPLEERNQIIGYCINKGKRYYLIPTLEDAIACGYQVKHFIDTPILSYNSSTKLVHSYFGKRISDVIISLILIILTSPIMLITAIAIKMEDHGKIFFKQKRVGGGGKVFSILKFRSMIMDAEKDGKPRPAVEGDPRITKVGSFIRKTRIDELPQLFNILKGDISLVGPRPERVEHVDLYTKQIPEFRYRLSAPAGLTGYAQIYGKYNTTPKDKLLLDLFYIEQQSFLLDAKMVFLTVKIVFTPESTEGFDEIKSNEINNNVD